MGRKSSEEERGVLWDLTPSKVKVKKLKSKLKS